jgi:cell division protein ZapA (FtsZ GTPase activity inhibitor)
MRVQISLRGRSYTVRSDEDEDPAAMARIVDRTMSDLSSRSPTLDDYTVAILAALNLASQLDRLQRAVDGELEGLDRDLASLRVRIDAATT